MFSLFFQSSVHSKREVVKAIIGESSVNRSILLAERESFDLWTVFEVKLTKIDDNWASERGDRSEAKMKWPGDSEEWSELARELL